MHKLNWKDAKAKLDLMIQIYKEYDSAGQYDLEFKFYPLKERYDSGERSLKLYSEMICLE